MTDRTEQFGARKGNEGIVRCDACAVLRRIRPGRAGACHRHANEEERLIRTDPPVLLRRAVEGGRAAGALPRRRRGWGGACHPGAAGLRAGHRRRRHPSGLQACPHARDGGPDHHRPALAAPTELTLRARLYAACHTHVDQAIALETLPARHGEAAVNAPWPDAPA